MSLVLPTGNRDRGLGDGSRGLQFNLPVSKQLNDWYVHWNGGLTWLPRAEASSRKRHAPKGTADLVSPFLAGSAIYRLLPMLNLMLESRGAFRPGRFLAAQRAQRTYTLSPGFRGGWNVGEAQIITGVAVPVSWTEGTRDTGLFLYLSGTSCRSKSNGAAVYGSPV